MADISVDTDKIVSEFGIYNEVTEQFTPFTEAYVSNVLRECSRFELFLTWLNNLGAWEYWLFQGNTTYGYEVEESQLADRSSFQNWDVNFTKADTERFWADVKVRIARTIRAVNLSQDQAQALGTIVYSIAVQEFLSDGSKQTVLIGKDSAPIRTEEEKLIDLEFDMLNTQRLPTQRQ